MQPIRIFISSPADVLSERRLAERVVQRLAREFTHNARIVAIMWEHQPMSAAKDFQEQIVPPAECDITVVILWATLGHLLPLSRYRGPISQEEVTGTQWEFENALSAQRDKGTPSLLLYRKDVVPGVPITTREAVEEKIAQKERVDRFFRTWTLDQSGASIMAFHRFTDWTGFEEMLERHLRTHVTEIIKNRSPQIVSPSGGIIRKNVSPYRGLEPFGLEHADLFFGRRLEKNAILSMISQRTLGEPEFFLIQGASGSGKSSLLTGGVLPDLRMPNILPGVEFCRHAIYRPSRGGADVIRGLVQAICAETGLPTLISRDQTSEMAAKEVRRQNAALASMVAAHLEAAQRAAHSKTGRTARLILIIDQLEELLPFFAINPQEASTFGKALYQLALSGYVWILATLRSDISVNDFGSNELIQLCAPRRTFFLTNPEPHEIRRIITEPARESGLFFETDASGRPLDELIEREVRDNNTSLPLLQYMLEQLWHRRSSDGFLLYSAYSELGGLSGAIGNRAEEILEQVSPSAKASLPRIIRLLASVSDDVRSIVTARPVPMASFGESSPEKELVSALLAENARLLVADSVDGVPVVRVAHEALLTHWKRAYTEIQQDYDMLKAWRRLEQEASRWRLNRYSSDLLIQPGYSLQEAEKLDERFGAELPIVVRRYIAMSSGEAAKAARHRRIRRAAVIVVLSALSIFSLVVAAQLNEHAQRLESQIAETDRQKKLTDESASRVREMLEAEVLKNKIILLVSMYLRDRSHHAEELASLMPFGVSIPWTDIPVERHFIHTDVTVNPENVVDTFNYIRNRIHEEARNPPETLSETFSDLFGYIVSQRDDRMSILDTVPDHFQFSEVERNGRIFLAIKNQRLGFWCGTGGCSYGVVILEKRAPGGLKLIYEHFGFGTGDDPEFAIVDNAQDREFADIIQWEQARGGFGSYSGGISIHLWHPHRAQYQLYYAGEGRYGEYEGSIVDAERALDLDR